MGTTVSFTSAQTVKLLKANSFTAVTGTTTRTISGSLLIPANTIVGGEILELTARVNKTGAVASYLLSVYINEIVDIAAPPAQRIAITPSLNAAVLSAQLQRTIDVRDNATISSLRLASGSFTDSTFDVNNNVETYSVDWTVDQYIMLAIENGSTADSTIGAGMFLKIFKYLD